MPCSPLTHTSLGETFDRLLDASGEALIGEECLATFITKPCLGFADRGLLFVSLRFVAQEALRNAIARDRQWFPGTAPGRKAAPRTRG